jgi:hypothetical protein
MGAGVLLRDGQGRVLLVEPTYKESWAPRRFVWVA